MFLLLLKWKSEDNMKDYSILGIDLRQQPRVNFLTVLLLSTFAYFKMCFVKTDSSAAVVNFSDLFYLSLFMHMRLCEFITHVQMPLARNFIYHPNILCFSF